MKWGAAMNGDEGQDIDFSAELGTNAATVIHPEGATIGFRLAQTCEIPAVHCLAVREIGPQIASLEVMQRVHRHDPDTIRVVLRAEPSGEQFKIVGCYGYLFLNEEGVALLEADSLDTRNPTTSVLALPGERPAQIYVWMMVARKLAKLLSPIVIQSFPKERYAGVPIAARAGTIGGLKSIVPVAIADGRENSKGVGDVFRLDIARTVAGAQSRALEQHR
jgi:hypothetical protein